MSIRYTLLGLMLILLLIAGCAPKKVVEEVAADCQASGLDVLVNDGSMDVVWKSDCTNNISGYNVYISETSEIDPAKPHNLTAYPGDTNPDDGEEHYRADHLENGKKYYVAVRIVNPNRTISKPTNTVTAVCGPRGEIDLAIRYKGYQDGYSFEDNKYVSADNLENDLYYYSKDGFDQIVSPHKLDGFLKKNSFSKLNYTGDFSSLRANPSKYLSADKLDKVEVKKGDWLMVTTADNENGLIKILDFSGSGEKRTIKLFFAFSSLPNEMIF